MSETSEITGPLIKALNQTGGLAMRMPVGKLQKGRAWVQLHEEGTADILFFPRSIKDSAPFTMRGPIHLRPEPMPPVWIETKDGDAYTKKSRKKKQEEFRVKVEALGHRYILAKTIDEGLAALR